MNKFYWEYLSMCGKKFEGTKETKWSINQLSSYIERSYINKGFIVDRLWIKSLTVNEWKNKARVKN